MRSVFVAATRQNDGKTMVSLGLLNAFKKRFQNVSYMKPVGQQYKLINGQKIDKDVVLFQQVYDLKDDLKLMSPVAVPKGFTEDYILNSKKKDLAGSIKNAYEKLSENKDFLLVEGTGHAGVGSVFDMSNGDVAKLLKKKVILVSLGGIGRAIDEIMLNKACFDVRGVELIGVIINKIRQDKFDKVCDITTKGLERLGIKVLGTIPYVDTLTRPTVKEIHESLNAEILSGECNLSNTVEKFLIGDMLPHEALNYFTRDSLLIVPANREGLVMTALCGRILETEMEYDVSAIVFSGGVRPHKKIMDLIAQTKVPVLLVQEDSFSIATKINNMLVKLRSEESNKIKLIQELVEKHVDIDGICSLIK